jgi:hypothetical protein
VVQYGPITAERAIRDLFKQVHSILPPPAPARLFFRDPGKMPKEHGSSNWGLCIANTPNCAIKSFSIFLRRGTFCELYDALCHEYAHALSWAPSEGDDHGPSWGFAFSRVITALEER